MKIRDGCFLGACAGSACGAGAPTGTRTNAAAAGAAGAVECITTHSGQWSASLCVACR